MTDTKFKVGEITIRFEPENEDQHGVYVCSYDGLQVHGSTPVQAVEEMEELLRGLSRPAPQPKLPERINILEYDSKNRTFISDIMPLLHGFNQLIDYLKSKEEQG
jgi:hypothetical protein